VNRKSSISPRISSTARSAGSFGRRLELVAVPAALVALVGALLLTATPTFASVPAQGEVTIAFGLGNAKGARDLAGQKVRVRAGGSANTSGSGGRVRIEMPVTGVSIDARKATTRVGGSIIFSRGAKRQVLRSLSVVHRQPEGSFVTGKVGSGAARIRAFTLQGPVAIDRQIGTFSFGNRVARLTGAMTGRLVGGLGLARRPAARVGKASLDSQAGFEDPYAATCELPAISKVAGTLPSAPDPRPVQPGTTAVGDGIFWGIRSALRNYLFFLPEGQGVMQGLGGGVVVPNPAPPPAPPVPIGFAFPFADGTWDLGEEGAADDRAVLNGSGSILLCHQTQFRILLSRPSIVINGFKARMVFDVDTNVLGEWIPTQRVKLAQLVTTEGSFSETADSATWANVPVVLTAAGSDALRLAPFSPTFRYQAGQELESISFTLTSTLGDGRR